MSLFCLIECTKSKTDCFEMARYVLAARQCYECSAGTTNDALLMIRPSCTSNNDDATMLRAEMIVPGQLQLTCVYGNLGIFNNLCHAIGTKLRTK